MKEITVDNFFEGASTIQVPLSDWSDYELIQAAVKGNEEAVKVLESRVHDLDKAVEADIVKVHRKAIDRAIARLDALPDDEPNKIIVPWAQAPRPKIPTADWGNAELRSYRIDDLVATQKYVHRDNVEWHLKNLNDSSADNKSLPNVVVDGDTNLIYDGHHRLVAYWLLGADFANCWTLEI